MSVAKNILKCYEESGVVYYKAQCCCNDSDHIHSLSLEYDEEPYLDEITLNLYAKVFFNNWRNRPYYKETWYEKIWVNILNIKDRLKAAIVLLFTGHLEMESTFLFSDEEQINDYISALKKGIDHVKNKSLKESEHGKEGQR